MKLAGIPKVINISENVLVFRKGVEEHDPLMKMLYMLKDNNLSANKGKCKFRKASVTVLSQLLGRWHLTHRRKRVLLKVTQSEGHSLLSLAWHITHFLPNSALWSPNYAVS